VIPYYAWRINYKCIVQFKARVDESSINQQLVGNYQPTTIYIFDAEQKKHKTSWQLVWIFPPTNRTIMSKISLLSLPVEILYLICDYLDIKDILCSFRYVCKQLYAVNHTYNRYKLNMCSMSVSDMKIISHGILPERIISLITHKYYNNNLFDLPRFTLDISRFMFNTFRFTKLQSLTLRDVNDTDIQHFFRHIRRCKVRWYAKRGASFTEKSNYQ
jgi:hypothetical protein